MLGEDVEDQGRPVDDLDLDDVLKSAPLARAELTVADHRVGAFGNDDVTQLDRFARPQEGAAVRLVATLDQPGEHERAGGLGKGGQLTDRVVGVLDAAFGPHAAEHDALQTELAVLDLGDILELGREARDAAHGRALLTVELVTVDASAEARLTAVPRVVVVER